MSFSQDDGLLQRAVADASTSDQLWIFFVTNAVVSERSLEQMYIDAGNTGAAQLVRAVSRAFRTGAGLLYKHGFAHPIKHPFDFRADRNEYRIANGGEWRVLRGGQLYRTGARGTGEPVPYWEPTPFDALDAAVEMVVTAANEREDEWFGPCRQLTGTAYDAATVPAIWDADDRLRIEVLIDGQARLRSISISTPARVGTDSGHGSRLLLDFRPHPVEPRVERATHVT